MTFKAFGVIEDRVGGIINASHQALGLAWCMVDAVY